MVAASRASRKHGVFPGWIVNAVVRWYYWPRCEISETIVRNKIRGTGTTTKKRTEAAVSRANGWRVVPIAAAIVVLTAAVYYNSLGGPFLFDDEPSIIDNPTIRDLGAIGTVLSPPRGGFTVSGRPVVNLFLAINFAMSGMQVRGYHLMNLAIHLLAGLTLFGIVRRTLLLPSMRGAMLSSSEASRANVEPMAPYLAGATALLWMVHPLQTESVTYIIQRAESLVGLFYFLTLYCTIRASESRPVLWSPAAVAACAMGMASKEVMATAPLIVLLYDRTFLGGSFLGALRKRWGLYVGLAACWGLQAYLMFSTGTRGGTVGFGAGEVPDWRSYGLTQFGAILHYLRLAFWPDALCLDYGSWVQTTLWEILPGAIVVAAIAAATIWGLCRGRKWGFLGAWFLVILAPTSSIIPIRDTVFEHRMYLSLAAVTSAVVLGTFLLCRKLFSGAMLPSSEACRATLERPGHAPADASKAPLAPWISPWAAPCLALAVVATALGIRTAQRNLDYRSSLAMWQNAVEQYPFNARTHLKLGVDLVDQGDYDLAIAEYRQAIRLDPRVPQAHNNLGAALMARGSIPEAIQELQSALHLNPRYPEPYNNMGKILFHQGKVDLAIEQYRHALRMSPWYINAHQNLAEALRSQGKFAEADDESRRAAQALRKKAGEPLPNSPD